MATMLNPSKEYYVDNCRCLHMNVEVEGDHPSGFEDFPQFFLYEVDDDTRLDVEVPSNNNPVSINLTGNIRL